MGLLDLSLIRILPLDEDDFDVYPLFYPLYEEMRDLFSSERVLPVKDGKGYTKAANAVIARSREIAELLPSELISVDGDRPVQRCALLFLQHFGNRGYPSGRP